MLNFPQPPKDYGQVYLADTDRPLAKDPSKSIRYALFTTIAKGGKSLIKSCKDLHLSRVVCYKTLKPEFAEDEIEQRRLLREARVSAMLQHPNTVPTYEIGRDNRGHVYFTMKLVHGYTLREILDYRERYDLTQLVDVVVQIGHALDYAHTHGVAHRDIKPENILVGPYGEVLLLDWGLAKVWQAESAGSVENTADLQAGQTDRAESPSTASIPDVEENMNITQQGELQGTVVYMSPEQIQRDPGIGVKTDIYSLGAVLYEILAGVTPHSGEKVHQVISKILEEDPRAPGVVTSARIPQLLEDVAMQCLRKDPAQRLASMGEMVRLLQEDWRVDLLG